MRNEIVFDIETKEAPRGFGREEELSHLGVSVVGVWSSVDGKFRTFREADFAELGPVLARADLLIGFAVKRFDLPVLAPHLSADLSCVPVLDIFEEVSNTLGHRLSLSSLAKATLGQSKNGQGLDAVLWYRQGDWEKLETYCLQDVKLTRDLYHYGREHGHLLFESLVDQKKVSVPVRWGMMDEVSVLRTLRQGYERHQAVEIDYVSRENGGDGFLKTRKIEIFELKNGEVEAYCHLRQDIRNFRLGRIRAARVLAEPAAVPSRTKSLF